MFNNFFTTDTILIQLVSVPHSDSLPDAVPCTCLTVQNEEGLRGGEEHTDPHIDVRGAVSVHAAEGDCRGTEGGVAYGLGPGGL